MDVIAQTVLQCPACDARTMKFIRMVHGKRTHNDIRLYQCNECKSLHNPSGYSEDDRTLRGDKEWHVNVYKRNCTYAEQLIKTLRGYNHTAHTLLDIGAGIGSLLTVGNALGLQCEGVEINHHAVSYAKEVFSLDISCARYTGALFHHTFDIITIISVLEHLTHPVTLFQEALKDVSINGILFVSVPIFNPEKHKEFLIDPKRSGSIFFDNDVHITHFTEAGLITMVERNNATIVERIKAGWTGYVIRKNAE